MQAINISIYTVLVPFDLLKIDILLWPNNLISIW